MTLPTSQDSSQPISNMDIKQGGYTKYAPPWGNNRTKFYGPKPFRSQDSAQNDQPQGSIQMNSKSQSLIQTNSQPGSFQANNTPNKGHVFDMSQNGQEEVVESPSVKNVVKNFEGQSRDTSQFGSHKDPVSRTRVTQLRETLARKSNENLYEASTSREAAGLSRSNEDVHQQLPGPPDHPPPPIPPPAEDTADHSSPQHQFYPQAHHVQSYQQHQQQPEPKQVPPTAQLIQAEHPVKVINVHSIPSPPKHSPPPLPVKMDSHTPTSPPRPPANIDSSNATSSPAPPTTPPPPPPQELTPVHVRQKSQEEIVCDKQAAILASQLAEHDRKLSEVILPPPDHKTTTDYMSGLFDTKVDVKRTPSLRVRRSLRADRNREGEKQDIPKE